MTLKMTYFKLTKHLLRFVCKEGLKKIDKSYFIYELDSQVRTKYKNRYWRMSDVCVCVYLYLTKLINFVEVLENFIFFILFLKTSPIHTGLNNKLTY